MAEDLVVETDSKRLQQDWNSPAVEMLKVFLQETRSQEREHVTHWMHRGLQSGE